MFWGRCCSAEAFVAGGGHYILTVKANQPSLHTELKNLPWKQIPICDRSSEHGHGPTKRTLNGLRNHRQYRFPARGAGTAADRTVTNRKTNKTYIEVVYAVASLAITDATATQVADWLRGHWAIENRLHWVPDVVWTEDHSQIRAGAGPQAMTTLRNTALSVLRLNGHHNAAKICGTTPAALTDPLNYC